MTAENDNLDKDKLLEQFLRIGLDKRTARNTIANNKVTANLNAVIHEAAVLDGCDRAVGNLLYTVATKYPANALIHRPILLQYITSNKVKTPAQLEAAFSFLSAASQKDIKLNEFEDACSVGAEVSVEEIEPTVNEVFEEHKNAILEQRYQTNVCSFFRKPTKNKNIRKRTVDEDEDEDEDEDSKTETSLLLNPKKNPKTESKLYFSSGPSKSSLTNESNVELDKPIFQFESSKEIQVHHDSRATATLETETEFSRDARAIRERVLKQAEEALKGKGKNSGGEKLYKGVNAYVDYKAGFRREHTISSEKAGGAHGPLRASAHIRASARFDYQPDICKDYKETGYCGYGDACKFMHDRGDYKSGWQLEKEWEEVEKARKRKLAMGSNDGDEDAAEQSDEDDEDALPFACFICREPFVDPVVTKCKHYFCEHCALKHHAKNKKCFVCNQPTLGIFNTAHEIRKKMAQSK